MEKGMKWMLIKRVSGRVVEKTTVCVPVGTRERGRREKTKGGTTALKQDENERNAEKRLARVINCNFRPGDVLLTASWSEEAWEALSQRAEKLGEIHPDLCPEDRLVMAAEQEGSNWIRRIQRAKKARGGTALLRYVLVASDMDGKIGEAKRVHLHALFPRWAKELAVEAWKCGWVDIRNLREQDDYTPIAEYLLRQVRRRPDGKKYRTAQNMDKPIVTVQDIPGNLPLKVRKNEVVMQHREDGPDRPSYLRVVDMNRKRPEVKQKGRFPDTATGAGAHAGTYKAPKKKGAKRG
ncbi:MAG: hypothetical protein Q4C76_05295 [Bacillota bacterium]|nr:hypothetical protein [Bacillota bacterium]